MKEFRGGPRPALADASTKALYDYWNALRNGRALPLRREVDPIALRNILSRIFMLEMIDPHHAVFRIAGTALCAAFGREFRDHNFVEIWDRSARPEIINLFRRMTTHAEAGLINAEAATLDRSVIKCEVLILPLSDSNGQTTRLIGVAGCTESLERLGWRKLVRLHATRVACFDPTATVVSFSGEDSARPMLSVVQPASGEPMPPGVTRLPSGVIPWRDKLRTLLQIDE